MAKKNPKWLWNSINTFIAFGALIVAILGNQVNQESIEINRSELEITQKKFLILQNEIDERKEAKVQIEDIDFFSYPVPPPPEGRNKALISITLRNVGELTASDLHVKRLKVAYGGSFIDDLPTIKVRWGRKDVKKDLRPGEITKIRWNPDTVADPRGYFCQSRKVIDVKVTLRIMAFNNDMIGAIFSNPALEHVRVSDKICHRT